MPDSTTDEPGNSLEQFVYDNPELERLEAILDNFNPFDALRWTRQEVRHSAFLRWLLDGAETHGLGPYFLRAFWKKVAWQSPDSGVSVVDIDSWDLSRASVNQEWHNIDVLVLDDVNRFIGVIENKVDTSEHSGQLQRYRALVEQHYPNHRKLYAYLTPDGHAPSDEAYVGIDYGELVAMIEETLQRRGEQLAPEVGSFLSHYVEMVRRHIVEDSEIQQLCRVIYEKHRRALDLIFEHRPDKALEVKEALATMVSRRSGVLADHTSVKGGAKLDHRGGGKLDH